MLHIGGNEVIGNYVLQKLEPEERKLGEYVPFVGNPRSQHVIKGRDSVRRHDEKVFVVYTVQIANLAAGVNLKFRKVCLHKDGVEKFGSHDEILQTKIVAYSSPPEIFVNA